MSFIYSLSDIHGNIAALNKSLSGLLNDFGSDDQIVFCGDYVDGGMNSYDVLKKVMEIDLAFPEQITVLLGNHDEWFCQWLFDDSPELYDYSIGIGFSTLQSFFEDIYPSLQVLLKEEGVDEFNKVLRKELLSNENFLELTRWLRNKYKQPRLYETDKQLFVHAGIDESIDDFWKVGTPAEMLTNKYPHSTGYFSKTIIAGHIYTDEIGGKECLGKVFWDGASHFYIDGRTSLTGVVPVLKYDTCADRYMFDERIIQGELTRKDN